jgi:2,4-dienoyl-CoA reductase-like NADH-dependent reductase (Old Yellow Enzyme family)
MATDDRLHTDAGAPPPKLFEPIKLRSVIARNRIVVSPMCQYASVAGSPTDWHLVHFGKFAAGGAGIVFGEETAVEARGRKTYECAGIYDDRHTREYVRITDFIKAMGAVPAIQLGHCGRRAGTHGAMQNWKPLTEEDARAGRPPWPGISASAVPTRPGARVPLEMTLDDIRTNIAAWKEAARRSADAGFDLCEIHGAHGYLIHQFLSPLSKKRTDAYGGDLQGRMRFALEIVDAVRAAWPADRPLFFRTSAVEGAGGDWVLEHTLALAKALKEHGVDVVDISSGGIMGDSELPAIPRVPGYHVGYAGTIRRQCEVPTMVVGLLTEPEHAERILSDGHADLIALSRELMYNPNWPVHAAMALGHRDPMAFLPPPEAYRLRGRLEQVKEIAPGSEVTIPFGHGANVPYSWHAGCAWPGSD